MKPALRRVATLRHQAYLAQKDPDKAITLLREALEMLRPGDGAPHEGVVKDLRALGVKP